MLFFQIKEYCLRLCSSGKPWVQTLVRRLAQQQKSSSPLIYFFQSLQGPVNFIRSAFWENVQFSVCLVRGSLSSSGSKQTLDFEKATKEVLVLVSGGPGPASTAGSQPRRSWLFVRPGIMRRAGEEADTGVPRGQGLGWGHWLGCARTSPHTQVLCLVLAAAFKGLLVAAQTTASRSRPCALHPGPNCPE